MQPPCVAPTISLLSKLLRSGILPIIMLSKTITGHLDHLCVQYVFGYSPIIHCLHFQIDVPNNQATKCMSLALVFSANRYCYPH